MIDWRKFFAELMGWVVMITVIMFLVQALKGASPWVSLIGLVVVIVGYALVRSVKVKRK